MNVASWSSSFHHHSLIRKAHKELARVTKLLENKAVVRVYTGKMHRNVEPRRTIHKELPAQRGLGAA